MGSDIVRVLTRTESGVYRRLFRVFPAIMVPACHHKWGIPDVRLTNMFHLPSYPLANTRVDRELVRTGRRYHGGMTLNIPGEVAREASAVSVEGPIGSTLEDMRMAGYQVIAEWARKEALQEAEDAVRAVEVVEAIGWDNFPVDPEPFGDAVRALMENEF